MPNIDPHSYNPLDSVSGETLPPVARPLIPVRIIRGKRSRSASQLWRRLQAYVRLLASTSEPYPL